jgi:OmpA-OmpF porin, OOP family
MKSILIIISIIAASLSTVFAQTSDSINSALINVTVTNFENIPQKGEQIFFENLRTKKIFIGITNAKGEFDILLKGGEKYQIKIKSIGEADDYNTFEIPALEEDELYAPSTLTIQFELPRTFTLDNVEFESGKSTLTKDSYKELKELLDYLKLKDDINIEIAGHTDDVGDDESNMKLSKARAETVRNYLISKGITTNRVIAKGYGETQPIASNTTVEGRQKNRRTEVRINKK